MGDEDESNVGVMLAPSNQSEAKLPSLSNNEASAGSSFGSSDDTSNGSNESEDSNESTEKNKINANTIFDMESADLSQVSMQHEKQKSLLSNVAAGLEDLVMTPLVNNKDDVNIDDETGVWKVLVRPELSGGLFVKLRFVHGCSRAKEARLMGLDHKNSSTVCLQVHVENMRIEAGALRHVRIVHRGGSTRGIISPSKVITPPEFPVLKKGMASTVFIGITFSSVSDRDGVALARFDVKSDHGTTSVEVRPTLGELLKDETPKTTTQTDFDTAASRLQGIQCISMTFTLPMNNDSDFKNLPRTILQHLNLKQIGEWTKKGKGSFVGTLPSSGQEVYVTVSCDSLTGYGDLIVCSNDAMAANSIMNLLKQALSTGKPA